MYQSESIELLAGARSKAQGDMKDAAKDFEESSLQ